MDELTFYRAWLAAPVILPLVLVPLGWTFPTLPEPLLSIAVYSMLALFFGGLPYALMAALAWRGLRGQPAWRVRIVALLLPIPMLALNRLIPQMRAPWQLVTMVCYGYVGAFLLTELVLRQTGWIRPSTTARAPRLAAR